MSDKYNNVEQAIAEEFGKYFDTRLDTTLGKMHRKQEGDSIHYAGSIDSVPFMMRADTFKKQFLGRIVLMSSFAGDDYKYDLISRDDEDKVGLAYSHSIKKDGMFYMVTSEGIESDPCIWGGGEFEDAHLEDIFVDAQKKIATVSHYEEKENGSFLLPNFGFRYDR